MGGVLDVSQRVEPFFSYESVRQHKHSPPRTGVHWRYRIHAREPLRTPSGGACTKLYHWKSSTFRYALEPRPYGRLNSYTVDAV